MQFSLRILAGAAALLVTVAQAEARCVKPVGRFAGTWSTNAGFCRNTGAACLPDFALSLTITFNFLPDGSGTYGEWGKRLVASGQAERFSRTVSFDAMGQPTRTFNQLTCRGVMTLAGADKFVYVVTGGGQVIRGVEYANSALFVDNGFVAEKL